MGNPRVGDLVHIRGKTPREYEAKIKMVDLVNQRAWADWHNHSSSHKDWSAKFSELEPENKGTYFILVQKRKPTIII